MAGLKLESAGIWGNEQSAGRDTVLQAQGGIRRPAKEAAGMSSVAAANMRETLSEAVGQSVRRALATLQERYGSALSEGKRDLLLGHYVYGLASVLLAGEPPARQLEAIETHLKEVLPGERAARALQAVPDEGDTWLVSTLDSIEAIGGKHGHALLAHGAAASHLKPLSNKDASVAGPAEPAAIESKAVEEILIR
ncbi:hypothetical protein [Ensifer aridi]|uniref:hypothetical protein n=1 Tax=Ensifer aridi TaxID=1708715 RepID=UPI001553CE06|nr:hypothetical protein [Ensifer aridi]